MTFSGWSYAGSESKNKRNCRSLIKSWPFGQMATGVLFWRPELVMVDGRLFFWAGCCRLWVTGLFLYIVWLLSVLQLHFLRREGDEGTGRGSRKSMEVRACCHLGLKKPLPLPFGLGTVKCC